MASQQIPDSLPLPVTDGHTFSAVDPAVSIRFEAGELRRRRRYTRVPQLIDLSWVFTQTEFDVFHDWFENELFAGTVEFNLQIASQDAPTTAWNSAVFTAPYTVTYDTGGYYTVHATLLLTGTPVDVKPFTSLGGKASFVYTAQGSFQVSSAFIANSRFVYTAVSKLQDFNSIRIIDTGSIVLQGRTPSIAVSVLASPTAGQIIISGGAPAILENVVTQPAAYPLVITGQNSMPIYGFINPNPGSINTAGQAPFVTQAGVIYIGAAGGLLDGYSNGQPFIAASTRKLFSSATYSLKARRASDAALLDIGFLGNSFDQASLMSFIGSGSARTTIYYNQVDPSNNLGLLYAQGVPIVNTGTFLNAPTTERNASAFRTTLATPNYTGLTIFLRMSTHDVTAGGVYHYLDHTTGFAQYPLLTFVMNSYTNGNIDVVDQVDVSNRVGKNIPYSVPDSVTVLAVTLACGTPPVVKAWKDNVSQTGTSGVSGGAPSEASIPAAQINFGADWGSGNGSNTHYYDIVIYGSVLPDATISEISQILAGTLIQGTTQLVLLGRAPIALRGTIIIPAPGTLTITGSVPQNDVGANVQPDVGSIILTGYTPITSTNAILTPAADPYWDHVTLLLRGDGQEGSALVDESSFASTITISGSPTNSGNSRVKYGAGAVHFPDSSAIATVSGANFAMANRKFTIEGWFYNNGATSGVDSTQSGGNYWLVDFNVSNTNQTRCYNAGATMGPASMPASSWIHWALASNGVNQTIFFLNGVPVGSNAIVAWTANPIKINGGLFRSLSDYDDIRFTQDVQRYTTTFTPPSRLPGGFATELYVRGYAPSVLNFSPVQGAITVTGQSPVAYNAFTSNMFGVYAVALVVPAYAGSSLRVRRSSDNTEQDIGFSSGQLDTTSLLAFVGSGNGFVTKWYDQSGAGNDLIMATTAQQPVIVMKGVYTAVKADGIDDILSTSTSFPAVSGLTVLMQGLTVTNVTTQKFFQLGDRPSVFNQTLAYWSNTYSLSTNTGISIYPKITFTPVTLADQTLIYAAVFDKTKSTTLTQMLAYVDGVNQTSGTSSTSATVANFTSSVISLFRQPTNNANSLDDGAWPACIQLACAVVYSTAKTAAEMSIITTMLKAIGMSVPSIPYPTRVAYDTPDSYLRMTEPSGTFADTSGNSRTISINGAGTITRGAGALYPGLDGGATFVSAQQTTLLVGHSLGAGGITSPFTVEMTVSITDLTQVQYLFGIGSSTNWGAYVRVNTDGSIDFSVVTTSGGAAQQQALSATGVISPYTSYHIIAMWDRTAGHTYLFVNNTQVAIAPGTFNNYTIRNDSSNLRVGGFGDINTPALCGSFTLDDFAFYTTTLPTVVRAEHYNLLGRAPVPTRTLTISGLTPSLVSTPDAFNPLDAAAGPAFSLSETNRRSRATAATATANMIRGVNSKNSGKLYIEFDILAATGTGGGATGVGLATSDADLTSVLTAAGTFILWRADAASYQRNGSGNSGFSTATNDVVGLAVDFTAKTVQAYKNNVLQNTWTWTPAGVAFKFWMSSNDINCETRVLTQTTQQHYAPPSGYVAWDNVEAVVQPGTGSITTAGLTPTITPFAPHAANTVLLLHGEGTDASTTFTDSSLLNQTMNAQGNAQIDTAQFRFGSSSMLFDGTGDYVKAATPSNFTIFDGPFTIAGWVRPAVSGPKQRSLFSACQNLIANFDWIGLVQTSTGKIGLHASLNSGSSQPSIDGTTVLPVNVQTHVAVSCDGAGHVYVAVNGHVENTTSSWPSFPDASVQNVAVGGLANGYTDSSVDHLNGWLDEFIVCNECLFTSDFVVPAAPFDLGSLTTLPGVGALAVTGNNVIVGRTVQPPTGTITITGPQPNPASISGLVLWLSADAITPQTDNTTLSGWSDISGHGNNATVNGSVNYRTTAGAAGGPAVEFAATGYFDLPNMMSGATEGEMFVTIKGTTNSVGSWAFGQGSNNNDESHYPYAGVVYESFGLVTGTRQSFTPTLAITSWRRYDVWSKTNDFAVLIDETSQVTYGSASVGWTSTPKLGVGVKNNSIDLRFIGQIGCVLVYTRKLSSSERASVISWLTSHPSGGTN